MNDLTTQSQSQSNALTVELAKMLGLVAPITMTADQHTLWLASAMDALQGIRAEEVINVSAEVRRSITRHSQIVPEIARLVAERRAGQAKARRQMEEIEEAKKLLPPRKHIMDRDRSTFTAADWHELSEYLEQMGSQFRYRDDGSKYSIAA